MNDSPFFVKQPFCGLRSVLRTVHRYGFICAVLSIFVILTLGC
jgi:hypothetical protein